MCVFVRVHDVCLCGTCLSLHVCICGVEFDVSQSQSRVVVVAVAAEQHGGIGADGIGLIKYIYIYISTHLCTVWLLVLLLLLLALALWPVVYFCTSMCFVFCRVFTERSDLRGRFALHCTRTCAHISGCKYVDLKIYGVS